MNIFLVKSMETIDPRDVAKFDPNGTIYDGDYQTLLHTKYRSYGPCGFREDDFFRFSYCKSMDTIDPRGIAKLDRRGMTGKIYVEATYQISKLWALWFQRRRFLICFH